MEMNRKKLLVLSSIILAILLIPIIIYIINFHKHSISDNPADWGTFGDYVGGLTGALLAIAGIIVTYELTQTTLKKQERTLRPLAYINAGDFENKIYVGIKNAGLGPLLIKDLRIKNLEGETKNSVIEWMPDLPDNYVWSNFFGSPAGYVIKEGNEVPLIEIDARNLDLSKTDLADAEDELPDSFYISAFSETRDKIRKALAVLTVELDYEDIYENKMPTANRKLDWFGRS